MFKERFVTLRVRSMLAMFWVQKRLCFWKEAKWHAAELPVHDPGCPRHWAKDRCSRYLGFQRTSRGHVAVARCILLRSVNQCNTVVK